MASRPQYFLPVFSGAEYPQSDSDEEIVDKPHLNPAD
jgi:hypothetical protein